MELGDLYKNRSIIKVPFVQNFSLPQMETTSGYKQESVTAGLELFCDGCVLNALVNDMKAVTC